MMQFMRTRGGFFAAAAVLIAGLIPPAVQAKDYPHNSITLYVQSAPGGASDTTARVIAQKLTDSLGVAVVILNEPAAGGAIALRHTAQAKPDGYTMMMLGTKSAVTDAVARSDQFSKLLKRITPVAITGSSDLAFVVPADSKYTTLAALAQDIKARPGSLTIGVGDVRGGIQHLVAELFKSEVSGDFVVVPYGSASKLSIAVQSGEVDAGVDFVPALMSTLKGNKVRALAVTGSREYPELQGVPTIAEAGFKGADVTASSYIVVPIDTPAAIVATLNGAINRALREPDVQEKSIARGSRVPDPATPQQAGELLAAEIAKWQEIVQRSNVKID